MMPDGALTATNQPTRTEERSFTVEQANRALVLVRKVVTDIVARCQKLASLREKAAPLANSAAHRELVEAFEDQAARCLADIHALHEELLAIGCVLKDWRTGLVDFPAAHGDHRIWLCWRLGEPAVAHWHERNAGFRERRPIDASFGA